MAEDKYIKYTIKGIEKKRIKTAVDYVIKNKKPKPKHVEALKKMRTRVSPSSIVSEDNPTLVCPLCRRRTSADMFLDITEVAEEYRGDAVFACDGCVSRFRRKGLMA